MAKNRSPSITCENQYSKYTDNQKWNLVINKGVNNDGSFSWAVDFLLLLKQIDFYKLDARKQAQWVEMEEGLKPARDMEETLNKIGIYVEDLCY